ncbi:MAG: ABC transporter ATP-binding protein [Pseudomonadota bacterium]
MASVELQAAEKWYGDVQVIKGVDLQIEDGELVVFVGPSGCGKSTLLRMIAGLEETSRGAVVVGGTDVTADPPAKRGLAMVFQSYALYPHLSVRENVGFPLKAAGVAPAEIDKKVDEAAQVLRLDTYMDRRPKDLSGGQRQRVAIGRSIVREPSAFLFDEPLSNLDAALRVEMRLEIAKLHRSLGATMIYVTHDQIEAMTLADRIVVLEAGKIAQVGSPRELYMNPANLFVAQFIGSPRMNVMPASSVPEWGQGADQVGVRPEHLTIGDGPLSGKVDVVEYLGAESYIIADCGAAGSVTVRVAGESTMEPGTPIQMNAAPESIHRFDAAGLAISS